MTWDFLCNSGTNLEELNLVQCVNNIQKIPPQKNLHKLALPTCSIQGNYKGYSTRFLSDCKHELLLLHVQGWAMKREDFKGEVGLTVVEWGGGELASPLLQVLPFSSNAAVDG